MTDHEEFSSWPSDRCKVCNSLILQLTDSSWVHKASWLANTEETHIAESGGAHEEVQTDPESPGSKDMLNARQKGELIHKSMQVVNGSNFWEIRQEYLKSQREYWERRNKDEEARGV